MKIFLTGGTGFIGSHLLEKLGDHEVVSLVSPTAIGTRPLPNNGVIEYGDLTDHQKISSLIAKHEPEIIAHIGAISPVRNSFEAPYIYQEVNFLATINLVKSAMKLRNFKKFIFASTEETYGWQKDRRPFTEDMQLNPGSPYAVSKAAAENYIKMAGRAFGFPHIVMKACNTYGRKNETGFVVEYIISRMLAGKTVQLGTPNAVRDLMFRDDHVDAYVKAIEFDVGTKEDVLRNMETDMNHYVFNFGLGSEPRMIDVAKKIRELTGFTGEIKEGFPADYPSRPVVEDYLSLNSSKARRMLGWEPKFDLDSGLRETVNYWKNK